jgi:hypothetical protein
MPWWFLPTVNNVPYVSSESAARAAEWEQRFKLLHESAGVIFVSVWAVPSPAGKGNTYEVRLGLAQQYEQATGLALIKHVLEEEASSGEFDIKAAVFCGSLCAYRDTGAARAGGDPS